MFKVSARNVETGLCAFDSELYQMVMAGSIMTPTRDRNVTFRAKKPAAVPVPDVRARPRATQAAACQARRVGDSALLAQVAIPTSRGAVV